MLLNTDESQFPNINLYDLFAVISVLSSYKFASSFTISWIKSYKFSLFPSIILCSASF